MKNLGKYASILGLGLAGLAAACNNGNATHSYNPTRPPTEVAARATATPNYCDLKRITETDSYIFGISADNWLIEVPYEGESIEQVGNFGADGKEIYGEVLADLNGQLSDANVGIRLDPNKRFIMIENRWDDPSRINIYQTDSREPPSIPASALPEGIGFNSIIPKLSPPIYCGPLR